MTWPQFVTLQPLGAQRAWTAALDGGDDQRAFYLVRLFDEGTQRQTGELVAQASAGDAEHVRAQLAAVAAAGKSNTTYTPQDERWRPSTLDAYRAAHPFVAEAVARTDRPDWAIRLAFEAAGDKKSVLSIGAGQAALLRGLVSRALVSITPWPCALEVIKMWADGLTAFTKIDNYTRERIAGLLAALLLVVLGDQLVWGAHLGDGTRGLVISIVAPPLGLALSYVARWTYAAGMRRELARFDEQAALEVVVDGLARGIERIPFKLSLTLGSIRRHLAPHVGAPKQPIIEIGAGGKLASGLHWSAFYDGRDETRPGIRYFRIHLFRRRRRAGELYAEVDTSDLEGKYVSYRMETLRERLAPIAESGQSNTSYRGRWRPPPAAPPVAVDRRELQRTLEAIAHAGRAVLQHEVREERAQAEAAADARAEARTALATRVEHARAVAPGEFAAWVDAQVAYYDAFLVECAAKGAYDSSDAVIARDQRAKWVEVRAGAAPYVEPPVAFARPDVDRYRRLFGIDPDSLADV